MKKIDAKHMISVMIAVAAVFSIGCITLADEIENEESEEVIVSEAEEEIVSVEADYAKNGWDEYAAGKWKYYENGSYVKGWKQIDGKWYWFSSSGVMYTGMRYDSDYGDTFIFGINGVMLTDCWQRYDNSWYYLNHYGRAVKGWNQIDGNWYYFQKSNDPYMHTNNLEKIEGSWYMFARSGEMLTSWQMYKDNWYYIDNATGKAVSGWKQLNGKWYYFYDTSIGPYMIKNTVKHITNSDGGSAWYGFDENGQLRSSGWYNDNAVEYMGQTYYNGNWYYFDADGKAYTGWKQISGKWFYFGDGISSPYASRGLSKINGKYYFFDNETCAMFTGGWKDPYENYYDNYYSGSSNHNWLYFGSDGVAYTGWKTIAGKTYFFEESSNKAPFIMYNFDRIDDVRYFFGDSGVLRKGGWFQFEGEYYYTENNGAIVESSWKTIGGKTYYFNYGGAMATGLLMIENKLYDFGDNGVCKNPPAAVG